MSHLPAGRGFSIYSLGMYHLVSLVHPPTAAIQVMSVHISLTLSSNASINSGSPPAFGVKATKAPC